MYVVVILYESRASPFFQGSLDADVDKWRTPFQKIKKDTDKYVYIAKDGGKLKLQLKGLKGKLEYKGDDIMLFNDRGLMKMEARK